MGAYHGKSQKNVTTEPISVASASDPAPPVFGSPIDQNYLASIASKVGVGVNLISEIASEDIREESPQTTREIIGSSVDKPPEPTPAPPVTEEEEEEVPAIEAIPKARKQEKLIPIVFHWDHKGNESSVYVCGSFNNWEKIPMNKSRDNFTAIVELPEGRHQYKFYVNGEWIHDPGEECQDNGLGTLNNVVTVTENDFDVFNQMIDVTSFQKGGSISPAGSYDQIIPPRSATSGLPPHLPSLLQQTVLNQDLPSEENPTLLPEPNHVTLNHLFALSIKDGVLVMGTTNRYKEKYITTLMYKPVQ